MTPCQKRKRNDTATFQNHTKRAIPIDGHQIRRVYESHGAALVLYARQWCLHPDDALQEALVDLVHQTTDPRDPVAWLFKTVRCKAMNQSRAEQRRAKYQDLAARQRDVWFVVDPVTKSESSDVQAALESLPTLEREIVIARIWGEMSFEQISELVDRPLSFIYRRYRQSLNELQKKLDGQVNKLSNES